MDGLAQKLAREAGITAAVSTAQSANDLNGLDPREVVDIRFFLKPEELDELDRLANCPAEPPRRNKVSRMPLSQAI